MRRVTDFRVGELRIPAERFPLPARVEELLPCASTQASVGGKDLRTRRAA
jgi:hypothetical protein